MQKTKMIFTIGPASDSEEILTKLIKAGMNVARLNFSHGTQETHKDKIKLINKLRKELNTPTAIMLDIKGPKIRTHNFINDGVKLKEGQPFTFHCCREILGNENECSITYDNLLDNIEFDEEPTLIKFLIVEKDKNDNTYTYLSDKNYSLAKIEYGDTPGYFLTDLTYAGELIGKAGETLTSVLDKIKNMLSNFEYYYDINGKFIF